MTEREPGVQDTSEKQSELVNRDEQNLRREQEENKEKGKGQGSESIAVVKSKIREKTASPAPPDKEASEKLPKVSNNKLDKISKRKRGKSKSSETLETQELPAEEQKRGSSPSEALQSENANLESKIKINATEVSKISVLKTATSAGESQDEEKTDDNVQSKPSERSKNITDDSHSTFIMSHDAEHIREDSVTRSSEVTQLEHQDQVSRTSQRSQIERGNYMSNISPAPLEDFNAEEENEKNDAK